MGRSILEILEWSQPIGQWQQPQAEYSWEPLGDPSARVFEVFLIVSQSVSLCTLPLSVCPFRRFWPVSCGAYYRSP